MGTHGTAFSLTQFAEVQTFFTPALAQACEGRNPQHILAALQNRREMLSERLGTLLDTFAPTIPAIGEVFTLTLNADAADPMVMLRASGVNPKGWKHDGAKLSGILTREFRIVQVGNQPNLDGVKTAQEKAVEGQWREAFRETFSLSDGKGPIGFADDSWVDPDGRRRFPYLDGVGKRWRPDFSFAGNVRLDDWLWLVPA